MTKFAALLIAVALVAIVASTGCINSDVPMEKTCVSYYSSNGTITAYDANNFEPFGPYFVWIDGARYSVGFFDETHTVARRNVGSKVEITYKEFYNYRGEVTREITALTIVKPPCNACIPCCVSTPTCQPTPTPTPTNCGCAP